VARNRRTRGGRSKPVKTDWIYNDDSYSAPALEFAAGEANIIAFPLSYSDNARRIHLYGSNLQPAEELDNYRGWYAIPEGSKQKCFEVDAFVRLDPATWTIGQSFTVCMRLAHFEQDPETGAALLVPDYSTGAQSDIAGNVTPAAHANSGFLKEMRMSQANISGTAVSSRGNWELKMHWRSERGITLGNNRALFMLIESVFGSITLRARPWIRSRWQMV